ncbi:MAG: nucleoside triphosphate pyrophosphohydrolase [Magnetococcales bacterium]|nr:nucleoside triphosphate pyrophosphohydrolase [Magnetococcales bacterium]
MTDHPATTALTGLMALVDRLRGPDGCPWDQTQTFHTLLTHTVEEAYEVVEAVENSDLPGLRQELGDLLFHVVLYSRIAQEGGHFDLAEVIGGVTDKMIQRHPHVFGSPEDRAARRPGDWERRKHREAGAEQRPGSVFDGLSGRLPALHLAYKVQQKMARVGFDWPGPEPVRAKVAEELAEFDQAVAAGDARAMEEELGDLLFVLANLARHHRINPERALRQATVKFRDRFRFIEERVWAAGDRVEEVGVARLEELWQERKALERQQAPDRRQAD